MDRMPTRLLARAVACAQMMALPLMPAFADDTARISFLESEIQKLRTQIDEQDRRIQRLEAEIERFQGAIAPARVTLGRIDSTAPAPAAALLPWHSGKAWDGIATGMTERQVTGMLGEPTAVEAVDTLKTLFYRGVTLDGTAVSGHVNLRDGRVVAVRKPATGG